MESGQMKRKGPALKTSLRKKGRKRKKKRMRMGEQKTSLTSLVTITCLSSF